MLSLGRRPFLASATAFAALSFRAEAAGLAGLAVHASPAGASVLLARVVTSGALDGLAPGARIEAWRSPDVLRAGIVKGDVRVFSAPSTVAANLYNRGAALRLLSVIGFGNISIVTADNAVNSLGDLRGRTIQLFFKNDMPDLVFRCLMRRGGLIEERDYRIDYAGSATEATQLLLARKATIAVLGEPVGTMALALGAKSGLPLRRAIDLAQAWGEITGGATRIPVLGIAVGESLVRDHPDFIRAFHAATREAVQWMRANPAAAGQLAARDFGLDAAALTASLAESNIDVVPARTARPDLESLWNALAEISPGVIGGRLPDEAFYLDV